SSSTDVSLSSFDEDQGSKLTLKARAILAYGLYRLESRGNTKMSVHLPHMRVAVQGFVVRAMTPGMCCSLYQEFRAESKP
ncbi:hypothetical protein FD755_004259, partial [Muntiacus reevesi]